LNSFVCEDKKGKLCQINIDWSMINKFPIKSKIPSLTWSNRSNNPKEKHCRQLFILQENAFDDKSDPVVYFDIKVEYKPNSSINL
jgi:hypothetical protein